MFLVNGNALSPTRTKGIHSSSPKFFHKRSADTGNGRDLGKFN